jgi:hypothetical protein
MFEGVQNHSETDKMLITQFVFQLTSGIANKLFEVENLMCGKIQMYVFKLAASFSSNQNRSFHRVTKITPIFSALSQADMDHVYIVHARNWYMSIHVKTLQHSSFELQFI